MEKVKKVVSQIPSSDRIILEVGTPLIKAEGVRAVSSLREIARDYFIIADLKTMDVGQVEVALAYKETADAVTVAGQAPIEVIDKFIYEAKRLGVYAIIDMINVDDPIKLLKSLKELPDVVELHRAIDEEKSKKLRLELIREIKETFKDRKILIGVAGGIEPSTALDALKAGADILVVGRSITQSKDIERTVRAFIDILGEDIDVKRVHVE